MQNASVIPAPDSPSAPSPMAGLSDRLEGARALIESRFSDAGGRLAGSLEMVGGLIQSLDQLGEVLNPEAVARTTRDLLDTAEGLTVLPDAQKGRMGQLEQLGAAGAALSAHIDEMRQTLRYLRAFAMNVKITAGGVVGAADEFSGFAERMCEQLDFGGGQLNELADQLTGLSAQLAEALAYERGLGGKYQAVIPAVPDRLAMDAHGIARHHARIAEVAASVAGIAREIQMKVAKALTALQIGDITRQRIEHVQFGLEVMSRRLSDAELSPSERAEAERRLTRLLADQMADTAAEFEIEAAKVNQSLAGMAEDTAQILAFRELSTGGGRGGLSELESSLGQAGVLVGDVGEAMANAHRVSRETVAAVAALAQRIDAIHGVKKDIQQMAINSSLRCKRLGDVGKPLNVIALELSGHAGVLEEAADNTLGSLTRLADLANGMEVLTTDAEGETLNSDRLEGVRGRLREAAGVEKDLGGLGDRGAAAARSLSAAADQLALKADMGDALQLAAVVLDEAAGPRSETELGGAAELVAEAMAEIARAYTMARERAIHAPHAPAKADGDAAPEQAPAPVADGDELDDLLF